MHHFLSKPDWFADVNEALGKLGIATSLDFPTSGSWRTTGCPATSRKMWPRRSPMASTAHSPSTPEAMGLRQLESSILHELRSETRNSKLRLKDILEWSTSEAAVDKGMQDGEVKVALPGLGVWCAIAKEHDKRKAAPNA